MLKSAEELLELIKNSFYERIHTEFASQLKTALRSIKINDQRSVYGRRTL